MNRKLMPVVLILLLAAVPISAQETPATVVDAYDALADTILAVRRAESTFVASLLDGHRHAAEALAQQGDWQGAAAQIALFANEGDNAVGGVRKRLLEGGHHFNAEGEEKGVYEPGYVIVTREAKQKLLAISTTLRQATDQETRQQAWSDFAALAGELLSG